MRIIGLKIIIEFIFLIKKAVDGNENYFKHWRSNADYLNKITDAKFGDDKLTILHVASKHGQLNVVQVLVEEFKMSKKTFCYAYFVCFH